MISAFPTVRPLLLASVILAGGASAAVVHPERELASESTGYLESEIGRYLYRGSAVVARDPKLLFSCAHLFYDFGRWATDYRFARAWDDAVYPESAAMVMPRGFRYFTSYVTETDDRGSESNRAFASDFTVLYTYGSFGTAVPVWEDGIAALKSSHRKRIVGYPSVIDFTGENGRVYQHATPWFRNRAYGVLGRFREFDGVSTGSGTSGGPVFVEDPVTGDPVLAGTLVSGTWRTAGVVALDLNTHTLASYALGEKNTNVVYRRKKILGVPDGNAKYRNYPFEVSGFTGATDKVKLSLTVKTRRRGELDVYLKSPGGRIRWISKRSGGDEKHLVFRNRNFSGAFRGVVPNGTWRVKIRDTVRGGGVTRLKNGALKIGALR